MNELARFFGTEEFTPHGVCLMWRPDVFWLHVASDAVIALAYFTIPAALTVFALKRKNFGHRWLLFMFSAFVLACGVTHLFGIWTMWVPDYGVEGLVKAATALISIATAIALWPLIPKALSIPSVEDLEERVAARTNELAAANDALRAEIDRRTATEARLVEARNDAEAASNAKSTFLSVMSHELRTPLNVILGYAQLIQLHADTVEDRRLSGQIGNVLGSGELLLRLIQDVLDLSNIEVGRLAMSPEHIDLDEVAREVVQEMQPLAEEREISVAIDPGQGPVGVFADRVRVHQLLSNLITNAIKYNDPGGRVVISLNPVGEDRCEVHVADDGWGIPSEAAADLFTPFARLGRETSTREGAGIGLALSRSIAEKMDGAIRYEPRDGGGSVFIVTLPRIELPLQAALEVKATQQGAIARHLNVLYVEDNPSNVGLMRQIFEHVAPDVRLTVATTGADGVEKARSDRPDLIFLDIGLPDIDGFEVLQRLRGLFGANTPRVVFVTADATSATRDRSNREGVLEFLPKPIDVRQIIGMVKNHPPNGPDGADTTRLAC